MAASDQARTTTARQPNHQSMNLSKRRCPRRGITTAEISAKIPIAVTTAGKRQLGAATMRATPNTTRTRTAVQSLDWPCHRPTSDLRRSGLAAPRIPIKVTKAPMNMTTIDTVLYPKASHKIARSRFVKTMPEPVKATGGRNACILGRPRRTSFRGTPLPAESPRSA